MCVWAAGGNQLLITCNILIPTLQHAEKALTRLMTLFEQHREPCIPHKWHGKSCYPCCQAMSYPVGLLWERSPHLDVRQARSAPIREEIKQIQEEIKQSCEGGDGACSLLHEVFVVKHWEDIRWAKLTDGFCLIYMEIYSGFLSSGFLSSFWFTAKMSLIFSRGWPLIKLATFAQPRCNKLLMSI